MDFGSYRELVGVKSKQRLGHYPKRLLTHVGKVSGTRLPHLLNATANYVFTGGWMQSRGFDTSSPVAHRTDVYTAMARDVRNEEVNYLEFGVWKGEATKFLAGILKHPQTRLIGFDSFEGLPETWNSYNDVGEFSTGGRLPDIDDSRVEFVVEYFEDSLPGFSLPDAELQPILNLDGDLYSSTSYVLTHLEDRISIGTVIYFDEFGDRLHELRAFEEFIDMTGMNFRLVAYTGDLAHVAFERTG